MMSGFDGFVVNGVSRNFEFASDEKVVISRELPTERYVRELYVVNDNDHTRSSPPPRVAAQFLPESPRSSTT